MMETNSIEIAIQGLRTWDLSLVERIGTRKQIDALPVPGQFVFCSPKQMQSA